MSGPYRHVIGFNPAVGIRCLRCLRTVADIFDADGFVPVSDSPFPPCALDLTWPGGLALPGQVVVTPARPGRARPPAPLLTPSRPAEQ